MNDPRYEPYSIPSDMSGPQQRKTLLWIVLGVGGLIVVMICSLSALLAFVLLNTSPRMPAILQPQPDLPPPPEAPRAADAAPTIGLVLIEEDFAQATNRWDQSLSRVVDGAYELRVDIPNYDRYGLFLSDGAVANFDMAVDVQQVAGDLTAEYGIRFRQSGPGNYLMFSISGSGYYRLVRVSANTYQSIVPWTFDQRIATGSAAVNRLRVIARGANITAFLNDVQVITTIDDIATSGQLTVGVTTFDQGGLVVRFDNIAGQAEGQSLQEDFSNAETTRWSIGGATIRDGAYELFAGGGIQSWQQPLPVGSSRVNDFVLEVEAELMSGADENIAYGVMFGDGGSFDFYSLFIFPDGSMTLLLSDGEGGLLPLIPRMEMPAINSGRNQINTIRVKVRSNVISLTINDTPLPDIESLFPIQGEVGMIVSSGRTGSVLARFHRFHLRELPKDGQQV